MKNKPESGVNFLPLILIGGVIYLLSMFSGGGTVSPDPPKPDDVSQMDVLDQSYKADRASKITILKEMSEKTFTSDEEQAKWWQEQHAARRASDFKPFTDKVAEAIMEDKVKTLVQELEK